MAAKPKVKTMDDDDDEVVEGKYDDSMDAFDDDGYDEEKYDDSMDAFATW